MLMTTLTNKVYSYFNQLDHKTNQKTPANLLADLIYLQFVCGLD